MARFILDVGTDDFTQLMKDIITHYENDDKMVSITCVNKTNSSQFHDMAFDNKLTNDEIEAFNKLPHC